MECSVNQNEVLKRLKSSILNVTEKSNKIMVEN